MKIISLGMGISIFLVGLSLSASSTIWPNYVDFLLSVLGIILFGISSILHNQEKILKRLDEKK